MKNKIIENIKTIVYALIIAIIIRTFLFQPFYIPSSSMEPNLLIGDRLFVSKYSYGYSRHSFPFSPNFSNKRFFSKKPQRGDVVVFKTPSDNRTDYIKRLIGMPGDILQFIDGELFLNNNIVDRKVINFNANTNCGSEILNVNFSREKLPNNVEYLAAYHREYSMQNTDKFIVPDNHYFLMGDNRDCSKDIRYLGSVGYVSFNNLVGKAQLIFFSNDQQKGKFLEFWKWHKSIRSERFFKKIK